jgi:hypothetical protein
MAAAVHRRDRTTSRDLNPSTATRPEQEISGNAGQTGNPTLPAHRTQPPKINYLGSRLAAVDSGLIRLIDELVRVQPYRHHAAVRQG